MSLCQKGGYTRLWHARHQYQFTNERSVKGLVFPQGLELRQFWPKRGATDCCTTLASLIQLSITKTSAELVKSSPSKPSIKTTKTSTTTVNFVCMSHYKANELVSQKFKRHNLTNCRTRHVSQLRLLPLTRTVR